MRKALVSLLVLCEMGVVVASAGATGGASTAVSVGDRYIAVYRDDVSAPARLTERLEKRLGFQAIHRYRHTIKGFAASLSPRAVRSLRSFAMVVRVERDKVAHTTASQPLAAGELLPIGVRRIQGLGATSPNSVHRASDATVAVIDTGIDLEHPELQVKGGKNCQSPGLPPDDQEGHGTAVAGIIGARNDGFGVVGVAPGTRLIAVKVLGDDGSGFVSDVICGMDWTAGTRRDRNPSNDVAVANLSLSVETARALDDAAYRLTGAGVVPVMAAGNNGLDLNRFSPGRANTGIVVTAMFGGDPRAGGGKAEGYSNWGYGLGGVFGNEARTLAGPTGGRTTAPGGGITALGFTGTSAAAPHVAATVALCIDEAKTPGPCAGKTPQEVVAEVVAQARAYTQQHDTDEGYDSYGYDGDPLRPGVYGNTVVPYSGTVYGYTSLSGWNGPIEKVPQQWYGYLVAPPHEHP